ncbi:unnamed protein product [Allacma fusca]|uniref:Uncharacterized protein n=1 Tax=Allacma fusca TaxID=39272 RepID=A0A8J2L3U8_9HEXA|nr:unnamed protein product [Allacma fusca]
MDVLRGQRCVFYWGINNHELEKGGRGSNDGMICAGNEVRLSVWSVVMRGSPLVWGWRDWNGDESDDEGDDDDDDDDYDDNEKSKKEICGTG